MQRLPQLDTFAVPILLGDLLDQCQRRGMSAQAWSPIAGVVHPAWGNTFTADDDARIRAELDRQASKYDVDDWLVVLAWYLMQPAQ